MRAILVVALLLAPSPAASQAWKPDPNARRIAWGTSNLVIRSDTTAGLLVWAATSQALRRDLPHRSFAARFEPDSVVGWLAYGQKVLAPGRPPSSPEARLQTPDLAAIGGSHLSLVREQEGGQWSSRVYILFTGRDGKSPWSILATTKEATTFLRTLFEAAGQSSYDPIAYSLYAPNPLDSLTAPRWLKEPVVQYPSAWSRDGQGGEVWLTFVIKPDSTVDRGSIRVLVTDGVELTAAAVRAVTSVRYWPAQSQGIPREALVFQVVSFRMRE